MTKLSVALVGANGLLAKPIASTITSDQFKSHFELPVRLLTRDPSKVKDTLPGTKLYAANDGASYEAALKGVDIVLDLRPPEALADLTPVYAAKKAGVKAYSGSDYGIDYDNTPAYASAFAVKHDLVAAAKKAGLQSVQFHVGLFLDGLLTVTPQLGFIQLAEGITDYPDANVKFGLTSVRDIALGVVAALTRPLSSLPPVIRFTSQNLTVAEFVSIYEKHSGKKFEHKPKSREAIANVAKTHLANGTIAEGFLEILRAVTADAPEGFYFDKNNSDFVNPGLFEWTTVDEAAAQFLGH